MRLATLAIVLCGCASTAPNLSDASTAVDRWGDATERLRGVIVALCTEPPLITRAQCDVLQDAYNENQAAFAIVDAVVP